VSQTFLRLGRCLLVAALFCAIGGHWAVLQTVAWASMIVEYSHDASVTQAMEKTFDGQHPCAICKAIQKNQQSEKKHEALQLVKKIELFDEPAANFVFAAETSRSWPTGDCHSEMRSQQPIAPPPRAALI
jgi:hypothetical protein